MIEGLIKIMRKTISASWLFETKLKNHNNLFLNDELADEYLVRAYSCKCGHDEIVTGDDVNKYYACTSCNNDIFMNTDDIYPDMESFVENTYYNRRINLKFNVSYEVGIYKNKVQAIAKIKIPTKIDFIKSKIIKKDVIVVGMPFKERMEKIVRSPFSSILIKLQKLALNKELFEPFIKHPAFEKKMDYWYFFLNKSFIPSKSNASVNLNVWSSGLLFAVAIT